MPPQTQGFATLEMLNILEQCACRSSGTASPTLGPRSPEYWHLLIEAKKLAYTDLLAYNGDPRFSHVPVNRLISKAYAASLCSKIDLERRGGSSRRAPGLHRRGAWRHRLPDDR